MNSNAFLASLVASMIDEGGFSATEIARLALTHETNTEEVIPPVEVIVPRQTRPNRSSIPRAPHGSMQPDGEIYEAIREVIFRFDGFTTVNDISKVSQQPCYRVTTVTSHLEQLGLLRRYGNRLALVS